MREYLGLVGCQILHADLEGLDYKIPAAEQSHLLQEDMIQVRLDGRNILDVGWYGNGGSGAFTVYIIRDEDWGVPVLVQHASTWGELQACISEAMDTALNS